MSQVSSDFQSSIVALIPKLRIFARSLTKHVERADDLVQETLLIAWEKQAELRDFERLKPWVFSILRNAFYMSARRTRYEVEDVDGAEAAALSVDPDQDSGLELQDTLSALDRLPADQREALVLVYVERMPYEAAAALLGCNIGTLKSRISRGRARLVIELDIASEIPDGAVMRSRDQLAVPQPSKGRAPRLNRQKQLRAVASAITS